MYIMCVHRMTLHVLYSIITTASHMYMYMWEYSAKQNFLYNGVHVHVHTDQLLPYMYSICTGRNMATTYTCTHYCTFRGKYGWIACVVALGEVLDDSLPLLGLPREAKVGQEFPQRHIQRHTLKFKELQVLFGYCLAKFRPVVELINTIMHNNHAKSNTLYMYMPTTCTEQKILAYVF